MKFLSDILAKAGLTVDGVVTLNNTATGQTPAANDDSTKLATTAWVRGFVTPYSLPIASGTTLGGIKIGSGLAIDGTGIVSVAASGVGAIRALQQITATAGQTVFTVSGGYTPGLIDVFLNGVLLTPTAIVATNGNSFTLADAAVSGDLLDVFVYNPIYNGFISSTDQVPEGIVNFYYTNARARAAISLTVTGASGASTYDSGTGVLNVPTYTLSGLGGVPTSRTITIDGVTYDLTANRTWNILPVGGAVGDILAKNSATNYDVAWIANYTSQVQHYVKLGAAMTAGTAVYVSGSTGNAGTNMIVSKASNATEATSSKTIGLLASGGIQNDIVFVVTEGLVSGIDTSTAVAGDPVWLGTNGQLIFGLVNKPYAPAHLVFIGIVTRVQQNNGEIFVKVQNGFEFEELHNLSVKNASDGDMIKYVASTGLWTKIAATTNNITEGTNLYYTDARVNTYLTANGYATQTYVNTAVSNLVASAPSTLDTLNELAIALGNDPNFATTIATSIGTKVPQTRTLTINGTAYDLSADRSWSIASGVTSFNTRTGAITSTSGDYTTAQVTESGNLYYTDARVRLAISLTTTGTSGAASYDNITGILNIPQYQGGVTSFNTRTGAITLSSTDVTTALTYTPVTNARTLTINGTAYDLTADRTWTVGVNPSARTIQTYTATASQTTFTVTGGYIVGLVDVFINGVRLTSADFTASNGTTVVLTTGTGVNNIVDIIKYTSAFTASSALRQVTYFTATAGQTTFTVSYTPGLIDIFYNGSKLASSEYTASNGTSIVLANAAALNDSLEIISYAYSVGAFSGQAQLNGTGLVRMSGTTVSYDNATYATQSYVTTAVANLVNAAPSTLDTLNELATALGNDANFATTITTSIATKQPQLSGTGFVKISGTTISYDNSTYLTTASASSTYLPLIGGTLTGILNGITATFTHSSGETIVLSKGTGPSIKFSKTIATAQDWALAGEGSAFKLYDYTAGTTPFQIAVTTGAATFNSTALFQGNSLTIGNATSATNVQLIINGVSGKAQRIYFQNSGTDQWLLGAGAASETSAFELYNASGTIVMSVDKTTSATTFNGGGTNVPFIIKSSNAGGTILGLTNTNGGPYNWGFNAYSNGSLFFQYGTLGAGSNPFYITSAGAGTFASSVSAASLSIGSTTNATNPANGSIVSAGGLGLGGDIFMHPFNANQSNYGYVKTSATTVNTTTLIIGTTYGFGTNVDAVSFYNGSATFTNGISVGADGSFGNLRTGNSAGGTVLNILGSSSSSTSAQLNLTQVWNGVQYPIILKNIYNPVGGAASSVFTLSTTQWNGSTALSTERLRIDGNDGVITIGDTLGYTFMQKGNFYSKGGGGMFTANLLSGGWGKHISLQRNDSVKWAIGVDGSDNFGILDSADSFIMTLTTGGVMTANTFKSNVTPGSPTLDSSGSFVTLANGAYVDFPGMSGMIIVNNTGTGALQVFICGGGNTASLGSVVNVTGTMTHSPGVGGYRFTNNTGSSWTFAFQVLKTRGTA